jgi:hypothetical protein
VEKCLVVGVIPSYVTVEFYWNYWKNMKNVECNINVRWEKGMPHHPKSIELYKIMESLDWEYGNDYFCWKSGGDGDNGETLMFELDIHFEKLDNV